MLTNLQTQTGGAPLNYVRMALRMRVPFGIGAMVIAGIGAIAAVLGAQFPPLAGLVAMHPITALCLFGLGLSILNTRRFEADAIWRMGLLAAVLLVCAARLMDIALVATAGGVAADIFGARDGTTGQFSIEVAAAIGAFAAAAILRQGDARLGGLFLGVGLGFVFNSGVELTYGVAFFGHGVSVLTALGLACVAIGMLSIYIGRPVVRAILVQGAFGVQTRVMAVAMVGVPWLAGFAMVHGDPARVQSSAAILSFTVIAMLWILLFTVSRNEEAAAQRRRADPAFVIRSRLDPVTGSLNRFGVGDVLEGAWLDFRSAGTRYGTLLFDLDYFRNLDDAFGAGDGEAALARVINTMRPQLRNYDTVARWGSDQIMVILKIKDDSNLDLVAARLQGALSDAKRPFCAGLDMEPEAIDVSFGAAAMTVTDEGPDMTVMRAEQRLDRARKAGAGRIDIRNGNQEEMFLFGDDAAYDFSADASPKLADVKVGEKAA